MCRQSLLRRGAIRRDQGLRQLLDRGGELPNQEIRGAIPAGGFFLDRASQRQHLGNIFRRRNVQACFHANVHLLPFGLACPNQGGARKGRSRINMDSFQEDKAKHAPKQSVRRGPIQAKLAARRQGATMKNDGRRFAGQ